MRDRECGFSEVDVADSPDQSPGFPSDAACELVLPDFSVQVVVSLVPELEVWGCCDKVPRSTDQPVTVRISEQLPRCVCALDLLERRPRLPVTPLPCSSRWTEVGSYKGLLLRANKNRQLSSGLTS